MGILDIVEIIIVILCAIFYGLTLFYKVKGNVTGAISELIAMAEETDLPGKEKMATVVNALFDKVPAPFKKILNKETLESLAQFVFDWMKRYAEVKNDKDATEKISAELASELIVKLGDATNEYLKSQAEIYGVQVADKSREEVVMQIALKIIERIKK